MTGIESLSELMDRVRRFTDQTSVDLYDLLPIEEREAIEYVREHGGIGHVKDICHDFHAVVERIGIEWSESELHGLMDVLDRRLMPEGMEWPRFDDGALVKLGDIALINGEADMVEAVQLWIHGNPVIYGDNDWQQLKRGERVKRPAPKVLDADGVEDSLELLQWDANNIAQALYDNGFPEDVAERIRELVRRAKALAERGQR